MFWENTSNKEHIRKNFNLRRYFLFFSIITVLVLTILLSTLFVYRQRNLMENQAVSMVKTIAHQLNHDILRDFTFTVARDGRYFNIDRTNTTFEKVDDEIKGMLSQYRNVFKVKIFDRRGLTLYSTDIDNIGVINNSVHFGQALHNHISTNMTRKMQPLEEDFTEKGKRYKIDILEVYIPIKNRMTYKDNTLKHASEENIIGVFEIYYNMTPLYTLIRRESANVAIIIIMTMSAFFLMLLLLIRRADMILKSQNREIERYNFELEEAQNLIAESIDEVITHESFHIRCSNNNLMRCWEHKACKKTDCPSYQSKNLRCWQIAGTFCGGEVQGVFAQKFGDCSKCDVFQHACDSRIKMIGESFNNMMTLLEGKHRDSQQLNERLNELANIDHLMQIGNRRYFSERIEAVHQVALRYNRSYSIIICDIDNFKFYNDTYGHQKGDYVLISIANLFKETLRASDEVFRWGGEEIIVLLPEQTIVDALKVAENLRKSTVDLAIEHRKNNPEVVTLSSGVATFISGTSRDPGWEAVIKAADDALYRAKTGAKNCVYAANESGGPHTFS